MSKWCECLKREVETCDCLAALPPLAGDVGGLIRRLRGEYRIPITDGLGAAGGDEPDNANEFVRQFPSTPIQREAADALQSLSAHLADVEREKDAAHQTAEANFRQWGAATARAERLERENTALDAETEQRARWQWEAINRAERLEAALREVRKWIDNWSPSFVEDDEWPAAADRMNAALDSPAKGARNE